MNLCIYTGEFIIATDDTIRSYANYLFQAIVGWMLYENGSTRVTIAGGPCISSARADVGATKGQRKVALTGTIVNDLQLHVSQHIADGMHPCGIATPTGGNAQLVLKVPILVVSLGQLYGMDALWKQGNPSNLTM